MSITSHSQHDPTLFQGTAWYYARYRMPYPAGLFNHLRQVFHLDGSGRALDLGCGTGQLALPLSSLVERVIGLDPDPEMIAEGKAEVARRGISNVDFVLGSSHDLSPALGEFRVVTMGESFHWMDRDRVLATLYDMIVAGGGVAIGFKQFAMPPGYQETVDKTLKEFLGEKRRAGQGYYTHPADRHEIVLARSRFGMLQRWQQECNLHWTLDDAIGHLFSTSYANKRLFADRAEHFENELRRRMLQIEPLGVFKCTVTVSALLGCKKALPAGKG